MRRAVVAVGLILLAVGGLSPVAAQRAAPQRQQQPADPVAAARSAVAETDFSRVLSDQAYAAEALGNLDLLVRSPGVYAEIGRILEALRLYPLVSLRRNDEARSTLDRVMAMRPERPPEFAALILATLSLQDQARFVDVVDAASRNVPEAGHQEVRALLDREFVWPVLQDLRQADPPARIRLAAALHRLAWRASETDRGDVLRMILIRDALDRRNPDDARIYAAEIVAPELLAGLLVQRRYDGLLPEAGDRLAPLRRALEARERSTADALARNADNLRLRLDRIQHLRTLGRNAEALALAEAQLRDPNATALASEDGMWIVNEAAYALLDLGRLDEARRVMRGLLDLPIDGHEYLISSLINQGVILSEAGDHAASLAHARRLEQDYGPQASDYGKMWIRATIVCALARLDRAAEAAPTLAAMRASLQTNEAAMTRAYLCLNDLDAAERLMVSRLEGDEAEQAVMALQDYALQTGLRADLLFDRLRALRERPAVRAALDRVARVVTLPVARTYWGDF